MTYPKKLPSSDDLLKLNKSVRSFPITTEAIVAIAKEQALNKSTLEFLQLFPPNEVFNTSDDFQKRSELLQILIQEERETPSEPLRNPQE